MADITKLTETEQDTYKRALQIGETALSNRIKSATREITQAEDLIVNRTAIMEASQAMLDLLTPDVVELDTAILARPVVEGLEAR